MFQEIKCTTAKEVYRAIKNGNFPYIRGNFFIKLRGECSIYVDGGSPIILVQGSDSPTIHINNQSSPDIFICGKSSPVVQAWNQSSPNIRCFDFSEPRITATEQSSPLISIRDSSKPNISIWHNIRSLIKTHNSSSPDNYAWCENIGLEAKDSSSPIVKGIIIKTYNSSSPKISAWGENIFLEAKDSSSPIVKGTIKVPSSDNTATIRLKHPADLMIAGKDRAKIIRLTESPSDWLTFYELPTVEGEFTYLYKALDKNFTAMYRNFKYLPGTTVEADDWDPTPECGNGLHFSPTPRMAKEFNGDAKKFVACKVKIDEIVVHPKGISPEKVKAPRVYEIYEVDIEGNRKLSLLQKIRAKLK